MSRLTAWALIVLGITAAADASPCRDNSWQPTYVHDLVANDGIPYYVMSDGSFVELTGDWANQSGPGMADGLDPRQRGAGQLRRSAMRVGPRASRVSLSPRIGARSAGPRLWSGSCGLATTAPNSHRFLPSLALEGQGCHV